MRMGVTILSVISLIDYTASLPQPIRNAPQFRLPIPNVVLFTGPGGSGNAIDIKQVTSVCRNIDLEAPGTKGAAVQDGAACLFFTQRSCDKTSMPQPLVKTAAQGVDFDPAWAPDGAKSMACFWDANWLSITRWEQVDQDIAPAYMDWPGFDGGHKASPVPEEGPGFAPARSLHTKICTEAVFMGTCRVVEHGEHECLELDGLLPVIGSIQPQNGSSAAVCNLYQNAACSGALWPRPLSMGTGGIGDLRGWSPGVLYVTCSLV